MPEASRSSQTGSSAHSPPPRRLRELGVGARPPRRSAGAVVPRLWRRHGSPL